MKTEKQRYIIEKLGGRFKSEHTSNISGFLDGMYGVAPDLTTWEGFGWLWEKMKEREDWDVFTERVEKEQPDMMWAWSPVLFAEAVYNYLHNHEGEVI